MQNPGPVGSREGNLDARAVALVGHVKGDDRLQRAHRLPGVVRKVAAAIEPVDGFVHGAIHPRVRELTRPRLGVLTTHDGCVSRFTSWERYEFNAKGRISKLRVMPSKPVQEIMDELSDCPGVRDHDEL